MSSSFRTESREDVTKSKFYIDITNELGLNYKKQRAALMGVALAKPGKLLPTKSSNS